MFDYLLSEMTFNKDGKQILKKEKDFELLMNKGYSPFFASLVNKNNYALEKLISIEGLDLK